jgi:flagellar hook-basal body complex protein FliE|tara:strand:- start:1384 stop:1695 length:312 start_codon:yes stop_codon:yes gene_type:complete
MSEMNVQQVLNQMRVLTQNNQTPETNVIDRPDFSKLLDDSINQVNELQREATEMKTAFETGDPNVDIPEVMVAIQKASLSFEAITEVRNKLLSAYQDVMNMQV